jgi:hypothetical protein
LVAVALLGSLLVAPASPAAADAVGDTYNVAFNTTLTVSAPGVLANDAGALAVLSSPTTTAQGGSVTVQTNGGFTFTPAPCFSGPDSFSYTALHDDTTTTSTATVQIQVGTPPASSGCIPCALGQPCPTAALDTYTTKFGVSLSVAAPGVLNNDRGASSISDYEEVTQSGGTVSLAANGAFTYQPPASFTGDDIFDYTISDGLGNSASTSAVISVTSAVTADSYSVPFNQGFSQAAPGVLANDGGVIGVSVWDSDDETARGGAVDMNDDGSFTYTPAPCVTGNDSFRYSAYGDDATPLSATVSLTIAPRPADSGCQPCLAGSWCPDALEDLYTTPGNTTLKVAAPGVLDNDRGASAISAYDPTSAEGGTVTISASGALTYKPKSGFAGTDTFNYTISNGLDETATAQVLVAVAPVFTASVTTTAVRFTRTLTMTFNKPTDAVVDVQTRYAELNGSFTAWKLYKSGLTGTSTSLTGSYGRTYCFQVRSRDASGVASGWSKQRCRTIPARSTAFTYSAGWEPRASSEYWSGLAMRTTRQGATASKGVVAERVYLVVSKCPTCGTISVSWKGNVVKTISLVAPFPTRRALVSIASFSSPQSGTLKVTVTSSGRPVILEGLAAYRN